MLNNLNCFVCRWVWLGKIHFN